MTYSLGRKNSNTEVHGLSSDQLVAIVLLCGDVKDTWIVKQTESDRWQNLSDVPQIWNRIHPIQSDATELPPQTATPQNVLKLPTPEVINAPQSQSVQGDQASKEHRKHQRHEMRLRVLIRYQNIVFRSFTRDISKGGMAIEHPLPEVLHGQMCSVQFQNVETGIGLKLSLKMIDRPGARFFTFSDLSEAEEKMLETFIEPVPLQLPKVRVGKK